ncbi:unnamed protein product [Cylindrotheca closterium]|uniref:Uncharacterized protein n=1 Tax=Cylindrotheca closterium TaxID=2856 RepID=A0AAD2FEE0_9STRA|nr:unnamed protein product [Cylindrotheca closterium]
MAASREHTTLLFWFLIIRFGFAWQGCSNESSVHGFCPTGNTCCRIHSDHDTGQHMVNNIDDDNAEHFQFGCIPGDMGKFNGTCCNDGGGCPMGYKCIVEKSVGTADESSKEHFCQATPSAPMADYITQRLPRYRLCSINDEDDESPLTQLHGLGISSQSGDEGKLAYYSSHGPIDRLVPSADSHWIQTVWIFIHGSGLNADDYFCSALAARKAQTNYDEYSVLVIAPWFSEDDVANQPPYLVWSHQDALHPWRYGADAVNHNISSYTALDVMVETLQNKLGPDVKIVISGHSSGGQMVQRWTFLTKSWNHSNMKAVVANPSSYLYLTPFRRIDGSWRMPPSSSILNDCPQYDMWKWGLADGGNETVPYRDRALPNDSAADKLIDEFQHKDVTYLAGSLDICNETEPDLLLGDDDEDGHDQQQQQHCHSHGLETTCMDELQGHTRMERGNLYMESLQYIWAKSTTHCHKRMIVPGVGHDHSLMFNSAVGMEAIFGKQQQMGHCTGAESQDIFSS